MPPSKRKAEAPAPAVAKPSGAVYLHEQLIHAPADSGHIPGESNAAVTAALNSGRRPVGDPRVDRVEDLGSRTLVVWAIPVEAA